MIRMLVTVAKFTDVFYVTPHLADVMVSRDMRKMFTPQKLKKNFSSMVPGLSILNVKNVH